MHYVPHIDFAFASIEHIMRDVNYGWLIRYIHAKWCVHVFYRCLFAHFPVVFFIAPILSHVNYYGMSVLLFYS